MANVQLRTSSWVFSPPTTTLTWVMILFKVATVVSILCPFQFTYIWFHCLFLATFWAKLMAPVQYIGRGETHMSPATAFQTMLLLPFMEEAHFYLSSKVIHFVFSPLQVFSDGTQAPVHCVTKLGMTHIRLSKWSDYRAPKLEKKEGAGTCGGSQGRFL